MELTTVYLSYLYAIMTTKLYINVLKYPLLANPDNPGSAPLYDLNVDDASHHNQKIEVGYNNMTQRYHVIMNTTVSE